jgi:mannose/fructose-specific phosphotransferase system component IIA
LNALVVTHGNWGRELVEAARDVYAVGAKVHFLSNTDFGVQDLAVKIGEWLAEHEGPAVVMVDVGSGSCGSASLLAAAGRPSTWILGGVNLPMVLTYMAGTALEPQELVSKMIDRALNAIDVFRMPT